MSACADRERARLRNVAVGYVAARVPAGSSAEQVAAALVCNVFAYDYVEFCGELSKVRRVVETLRRQEGGR